MSDCHGARVASETRRRGVRRATPPCASDSGPDGRAGLGGGQRAPASGRANPGGSRRARRGGAERAHYVTECTRRGCWRHDERVRGARGASPLPGHVPRGPQGGRGRIQGLVEARARAEVRARPSTPCATRPSKRRHVLSLPVPRRSRVFPGDSSASASSPRVRREPARPRSYARRDDHAARPSKNRRSATLLARDPRPTRR